MYFHGPESGGKKGTHVFSSDSGSRNTTTKLYRVMSNEEYESLMRNGKFSSYDMAMEDKWFATTWENAECWAEYFYPDGNYKMVEIEVSTSSLSNMYFNPYLDGIGPVYSSSIDILNDAIQSIRGVK